MEGDKEKSGPLTFCLQMLTHPKEPNVPSRLQYEPFSKWRDKGLISAVSLFDENTGSLKPFNSLAEDFHIPNQQFHKSQTLYIKSAQKNTSDFDLP